jgi:hypothetical protein
MKKILVLLFLLVSVSVNPQNFFFGMNKTKGVFFSATPTNVDFKHDTSACSDNTIDITSSGSWTASPSTEWIHVSSGSGSGNATITITVDSNAGVYRGNIVVLASSGFSNIVITVTQTANGDECL